MSKGVGQSKKVLLTSEAMGEIYKLVEENEKGDSLTMQQVKNAQRFYEIFREFGEYKEINDSILLKNNPFLTDKLLIRSAPVKKILADSLRSIDSIIFIGEEVVVSYTNPVGSAPWQAAVLEGTAKFLAQRFKEEIAAYYLNTFYGKLDDKPLVKALFPNTVGFLKVFSNQVYNTDITILQSSAEEDLQNLPANLLPALDHIDAIKNNPDLKAGISVGLDIYNQCKAGYNIAEAINELPFKNYVSDTYKPYLQVLRIFVNSMRSSDYGNDVGPWGDIRDLNVNVLSDIDDPYLYALLYEQLKDISFKGKTLKEYLTKKNEWVSWFRELTDLYRKIIIFNEYLVEQKKLAKSKAPDFWESLTKGIDLFNVGMQVINRIPAKSIKIPDVILTVSDHTSSLMEIVRKTREKQYEQVVPGLIMLLTKLAPEISNEKLVPYMRYAGVIAQFAAVQTADDMKNLLQSVALPIGSASIKRKSKWNVSLNAYVGVAAGWEEASKSSLKQERTSIGLTAPIGIAISKQYHGANKKSKWPLIPSGTFFVSIFDLGNLVNARLKSDTASIGDVKFSHFISLGAGYFVNFRNSPFSAGISARYVPAYRDVFVDNKWLYKADAFSIRFSFVVDIPVFNFYNKPNE